MKKNFKFSPEFRQSAVSRVLNGETQVEVKLVQNKKIKTSMKPHACD